MLLTFPICVSLMLSCILLGVFQFLFLFADISDDVFSFWSPGILFDFLHVWLLMDVFVCCCWFVVLRYQRLLLCLWFSLLWADRRRSIHEASFIFFLFCFLHVSWLFFFWTWYFWCCLVFDRIVYEVSYVEAMPSKIILMMPKNQESSKFQESRSRFKIQDSSKESRLKIQESREDSIKISIKRVFQNIE